MRLNHFPLRKASMLTAAVLVAGLLMSGCATGAGQPPTPPTAPAQKERPAAIGSTMLRENGIVIREFALKERPDHIEAFSQLPTDVWEDLNDSTHGIIDRWGHPLPSQADLNDALAAWGMSVHPTGAAGSSSPPEFELLKGEQVLQKLSFIGSLSRSQDGRRALFVAEGPQSVGNVIFLDGKLQDWDAAAADFVPPIFVGNALLSLTQQSDSVGVERRYAIRAEAQSEPLYTFDSTFMTDSPIHGFYSTGDQWVLEYDDRVLINGKDLGKAKGYDKVFDHRDLAGKPFFLFEQDSRVFISFGGRALSPQYDEVLHNSCCEPAIANPRTSEIAARFFARRGEQWYYVSALVPAD